MHFVVACRCADDHLYTHRLFLFFCPFIALHIMHNPMPSPHATLVRPCMSIKTALCLKEIASRANSCCLSSQAVVNTPLVQLHRSMEQKGCPPKAKVYAKLEGDNACQSNKARAAMTVIMVAEQHQYLTKVCPMTRFNPIPDLKQY